MDYEVIVVGGGIGGLATAALLAARGVNVCLLERQSHVGGCVANFEHLGYKFEPTAGLYSGWQSNGTWAQIFAELPLPQPAISKLSPNYVVRLPDGRDVTVCDDRERFEHGLAAAFPECPNAASNFFGRIDEINEHENHQYETVAQFLSDTSADFRLFIEVQLQTLAQCGSAACSAARAAGALAVARGGMWAITGGAQALADRLVECLKQSGGVVRLNSPVLRLAYASNGTPIGIDLLSGERVRARRAIISNLTVWDTYGKLIGLNRTPKSISVELKKSFGWGAYLIFIGMEEAASSRLPSSRLFVIGDVSSGQPYAPDQHQLALNAAPEGDVRAPAGKRAVTASTYTNAADWFSFHQDEASHEEQDQATLETVWSRLHSALPELGDAVEVIETATPRTFYDTTRRRLGMIGAPLGSSTLIPHAQAFGVTSFPNVFMVGDTACSGIGLEGVACSAWALANFLAPLS